MPNPQFTLGQQFGRFLVAGALVFIVAIWLTTSIFLAPSDANKDQLAVRIIIKSLTTQRFGAWLRDLDRAYLPFFLMQRPLVASYLISAPLAWAAAFLYDVRILRKENLV
jgi:hypothetical protein